jgi:hypothetical protein
VFLPRFRGGARLPAVVCSSPCYSNHVIAFEPQRCAGPIVAVAVDLAPANDHPFSRRALHLIRFLSLDDVIMMLGMRAVAYFPSVVSLNAQREKHEHGGNQQFLHFVCVV